jgi:hypothetical protein
MVACPLLLSLASMAPTSLYILTEVKRASGELAEGAGAFRPLD